MGHCVKQLKYLGDDTDGVFVLWVSWSECVHLTGITMQVKQQGRVVHSLCTAKMAITVRVRT